MIQDYFKLPWREIRRRKMRSWLTLMGIFIGIAVIVSLVMLGQGLENAVEEQFSALGNDKLLITAKGNPFSAGTSLDAIKITDDDLEVIRGVMGVERAGGIIYSTAKIEFNDLVRYPFVMGIPTDSEGLSLSKEALFYTVVDGRFLSKGDNYKAVLGYDYTQDSMFEKAVEVRTKILINDIEFKVVGTLEKIGSPPDDQGILIPLDVFGELFDQKGELGTILLQIQAGEDLTKIEERVSKELRDFRGVDEGEEDFSVQTPTQMMDAFSNVLNMVQVLLIGIAAISLLVGGIGIMNTMYTTVLERTKEIGLMKSLGARRSHILKLFLIESGFYGLGGGLIGIIIGISFAKLAELMFSIFVGSAFLSVEINWVLILGTLAFSFLIGCIAGITPAIRASKMNPVDALRYE